MKQKLGTLASALAWLRRRLSFFHGATEADGSLGTQRVASSPTQVNRLAMLEFPMHGSSECFPYDSVEEPDFH